MAPTVGVTYDFDAVSPWLWTYELPSNHEMGVFGADVGAPRLLDLHDELGIPATWFIPGHTIESFPEACEEVRGRGHDVQHHMWSHAPLPSYDTRVGEEADLVRGKEAIEDLTGSEPVGFRAPFGGLSEHTLDLLEEHGFEWLSSAKARDFRPYYVRKNPTVSRGEPYGRGEETDLVNVPIQWQRDDWIQMAPVDASPDPRLTAVRGSMMSDADVFERVRREFDWMVENVDGGVYVLVLHPQISGRASAVAHLEDLFDHMRSVGAGFEELSAVVEAFRG